MTAKRTDGVGHDTLTFPRGSSLAPSAVGVTTAGTISGTTAAGAAPTVAIPSGFISTDRAGTFELTPVTGGGAQAAGDVATVRFVNEYAATPAAVIVQMVNTTATPDAVVSAAAAAVTTQGFNVNVAAALTTATVYRVTYTVVPGGTAPH